MPIDNERAQGDLHQFISGGSSRIIWSFDSHDPWFAQSISRSAVARPIYRDFNIIATFG
jgi:hypothetical protein